MLDISTGYNKYKFLGNEFLTWIWFLIENEKDLTSILKMEDTISLEIGNSLVLENKLGDKSKEKITIKGDQAGLEEGTTALKKGAYVVQMNIICKINEDEFKFTVKGESFNLSGIKTPAVQNSSEDEIEGSLLEKIYLYEKIFKVIDTLYLKYMGYRISDEWKASHLKEIRNWINSQ